jgi:hypothetical protein
MLFDLTDSVHGVLTAGGRRKDGAGTFRTTDEVAVMVYSGHRAGWTGSGDRTQTLAPQAGGRRRQKSRPTSMKVYQAAINWKAGSPANRPVIWLTDNLPNVPYRRSIRPTPRWKRSAHCMNRAWWWRSC